MEYVVADSSRRPLFLRYSLRLYEDVLTIGKAHGAACSCSDDSVTMRLRAVPATA